MYIIVAAIVVIVNVFKRSSTFQRICGWLGTSTTRDFTEQTTTYRCGNAWLTSCVLITRLDNRVLCLTHSQHHFSSVRIFITRQQGAKFYRHTVFSHPICAHNSIITISISIQYYKVISLTVITNLMILLCSKTYAKFHAWKIARWSGCAANQLSGFHCQRNISYKFTRIELLGYHVWRKC